MPGRRETNARDIIPGQPLVNPVLRSEERGISRRLLARCCHEWYPKKAAKPSARNGRTGDVTLLLALRVSSASKHGYSCRFTKRFAPNLRMFLSQIQKYCNELMNQYYFEVTQKQGIKTDRCTICPFYSREMKSVCWSQNSGYQASHRSGTAFRLRKRFDVTGLNG